MRAVVDTNVLISSLFWGGRPRRVVDLAAAGRFQALTSAELLSELEVVLAEDFGVPQERIDLILRDVLSYAEVVVPSEEVTATVRDVEDIKVIACAVAGQAECIVTGDGDLLALEMVGAIAVLAPADFLRTYF